MKITDFFSVKLANKLHIAKTSSGSFWSFLLLFITANGPLPYLLCLLCLTNLYSILVNASIIVSVCQRTLSLPLYHRTSTMQRYDISRALWEMVRNSVCSVSAAHLSSPCRGGYIAPSWGAGGWNTRRETSFREAWGERWWGMGGTIFCDDSCSCPATALAGYCAKSERDELHIVAVRCEG